MEPQALHDNGRNKARVSHAASQSTANTGTAHLYEYPLPYCNSGNLYCFRVCSIVLIGTDPLILTSFQSVKKGATKHRSV